VQYAFPVTDGDLDAVAFATSYSVEVDPEFPGSGDWDCAVFNFGRDGGIEPTLESRWGTPTVVRVEPDAAAPWVGMFPAGGLGGVRDVLGCPAPTNVVVVADGLGFLVDVERPEDGAQIVSNQVWQVVAMPEPPLLLFVGFSEIHALGTRGIAWSSRRLCLDELRVIRVTAETIECTCENLGGSSTIEVDPRTGHQIAGTTMRDLGWPGE
jgi:hypothetical protein